MRIYFSAEVLPYPCQNKSCGSNSNVTKICHSIQISIKYSIGSPPPLYLCIECANEIHREHPNQEFRDVLLPVHQASTSCDYKVRILIDLYFGRLSLCTVTTWICS